MRIYLDCCCLQRPFDDQTQPRIKVEAEAVLAILASVSVGSVEIALLSSEALEYEMSRIPDGGRQREAFAILALAKERLEVTSEVQALAESFEGQGIRPIDAVHLAFASRTRAEYFVTCDDKLLRKSRRISVLECKVVSVLDFVQEVLK